MIIFNNPSTSPWMTTLTLTIIFFCLIISTFLNPTVFLYNKKKTSIAGLLFCIISATDFVTCIYFPTIILYYASTLNLEEMGCDPEKPQLCQRQPTKVNLATAFTSVIINTVILLTTGILAITRSIQIGHPFYRLKKSRVLFILSSIIALQVMLWTFMIFSPFGTKVFRATNFMSSSRNIYGRRLQEKPKWIRDVFSYFQILPILSAQACALVASVFSSFTLFNQRNHTANPDHRKNRTASALKVMLTNIPSLIYALILGTPIFLLVVRGEKATEVGGWATFYVANMLPLLSSVWNPLVFICLTPKSREYIRSIAARIGQYLAY